MMETALVLNQEQRHGCNALVGSVNLMEEAYGPSTTYNNKMSASYTSASIGTSRPTGDWANGAQVSSCQLPISFGTSAGELNSIFRYFAYVFPDGLVDYWGGEEDAAGCKGMSKGVSMSGTSGLQKDGSLRLLASDSSGARARTVLAALWHCQLTLEF